jgi:hypothetical protein
LRRSMCSSMCREFGLAGDWRSQASQVVLPLSRRFQQFVKAAAMRPTAVRPRRRRCAGWRG